MVNNVRESIIEAYKFPYRFSSKCEKGWQNIFYTIHSLSRIFNLRGQVEGKNRRQIITRFLFFRRCNQLVDFLFSNYSDLFLLSTKSWTSLLLRTISRSNLFPCWHCLINLGKYRISQDFTRCTALTIKHCKYTKTLSYCSYQF